MITDYTTMEILPEIGQHQVRYEEYILGTPKNPKMLPLREFLPYGVFPIIDCEIDDDYPIPDYSKYILPNTNKENINPEEKKTTIKDVKQRKAELSLDLIYTELREMKFSAIRKIINESKDELLKVKRNPPSPGYLNVTRNMYSIMFNPNQKCSIYTCVRETLNVPPHLFHGNTYLYSVLAPEAALLIFQKKYKLNTKEKAMNTLTTLLMADQAFFDKKAASDLHSRT